MFVGKESKRMVVETRAKPKDIEKRDAKPPTIFKATVNKKDLRFLYNILYNDKNKKQNCKLNTYIKCKKKQKSLLSVLDQKCKTRSCITNSQLRKGLFLHLKKK